MKHGTRIFLWLAGFISALVLIGLLGMMFAVQRSRAGLEEYRAELHRRGESLDGMELSPKKAPTEGNGGPMAIAMAKELQNVVYTTKVRRITLGQNESGGVAEVMHRLPTARRMTADVPWSEAEAALAPMQESLATLRAAAREPVLAIDLDYARGVAMPMDQITAVLSAVQYLAMDALVRLHRGEVAGAVEDIETQLRLTQITAGQPILISQLVHCSLLSLTQISTWETLQAEGVTAEDLARLQSAWEATTTPTFAATIRLERAVAAPMFAAAAGNFRAMAGTGGWSSGGSGTARTPTLSELRDSLSFAAWKMLFRYADERQFLENYQSLLDETQPGQAQDWSRTFETMSRIEAELATAGMGRLFSKTQIPALRTSVERFPTTETLRSLTIAAIALRRYQLDHEGALPEGLEELVPKYLAAVPRDPLGDGAVRYKREAEGFVLYSVGLDGVDGGGDASQLPDRKQKSIVDRMDIVWPKAVR